MTAPRPIAQPDVDLIQASIDRARQLIEQASWVVSNGAPNWGPVSASLLRRAELSVAGARQVHAAETGVPLPASEATSRQVAQALGDLSEAIRSIAGRPR